MGHWLVINSQTSFSLRTHYSEKNIYIHLIRVRASQVVLVEKNLAANVGGVRETDSILGWGRCPGGGHGNPLQYSCLENPMDKGAWWATVHSVTKRDDASDLEAEAAIKEDQQNCSVWMGQVWAPLIPGLSWQGCPYLALFSPGRVPRNMIW